MGLDQRLEWPGLHRTRVCLTLAGLRPARLASETTYNTIRPHQALGYRIPAEFLATIEPEV